MQKIKIEMHKSFNQRQTSSNKKYPSSAKDQNKMGSSRLFHGALNQFQDKNSFDKQE